MSDSLLFVIISLISRDLEMMEDVTKFDVIQNVIRNTQVHHKFYLQPWLIGCYRMRVFLG